MSKENIIKELVKAIDYYNYMYWVHNNPVIDDETFDTLYLQLKKVDPTNPILYQKYESINNSFRQRIKHINPAYSLEKEFNLKDIINWFAKISRSNDEKITIQPKYDGCSAEYRNDDKILLSAGREPQYGFNISDKKSIIWALTPTYNGMLNLCPESISGEIVITKTNYQKYKNKIVRKDKKIYTDERNMAAGIINQKNIPEILHTNGGFLPILLLIDFNYLNFEVTFQNLSSLDIENILSQAKQFDYPIDGLVFKLADDFYSNSLGFTAHHPRGQVAYKTSYNEVKKTKLISVDFQVGKNVITPVALIEPITIDNYTITRANLHNAYYLLKNNIHINDYVFIRRSGGIIPDIVDIEFAESSVRKPISIDECPVCGAELVYYEPFLYCTNNYCPGTLTIKLKDSAKRLNINSLGSKTIEKLISIDINTIDKILNLDKNTISKMPGFTHKSIDNLYNELSTIKNSKIEDWRILSCLNINMIGKILSKEIMKYFTLEDLQQNITIEDLQKIPKVGSKKLKLYTMN